MKYEYTFDGWVLIILNMQHSHPLETSTPAVMSLGSARHIPTAYNELGVLLARSGLPALKLIMRVLWTKSQMDGVPEPLFNRQDVYNRYVRTTTQDKELDARYLVSSLSTSKAATGLEYRHVSDTNDGGLSRLFVAQVVEMYMASMLITRILVQYIAAAGLEKVVGFCSSTQRLVQIDMN